MSKSKHGLIGKPSKASLKARGLPASKSNLLRQRSNSISDGFYSLYSTDSEDNVSGINHGLDKCAELLTNILEIKSGSGKDMRKSAQAVGRQRLQRPGKLKNKKEKSAPSSKSSLTKSDVTAQKLKAKTAIIIPTGESQSNENVQKLKTAYNDRVVASTPVLTAEQRRHLQELHKREHALQQQIQLLQDEYENLEGTQKHGVVEISPKKIDSNQTLIPGDNNSKLQESKLSRRSLDFTNNAEKPFVDNPQIERGSPSKDRHIERGTPRSSKDPNIESTTTVNERDSEPRSEPENRRKVQFSIKTPEARKAESTTGDKVEQYSGSPLSQQDRYTNTTSPKGVQINNEESVNVSKRQSPQKYTDHLRILAHLVGELRAILVSSGDNEVSRLLNEIESEIRLLTSYTVHPPRPSPGAKVKKQHDIDTEIALQPLRSENSDLRRKLRIANQRTREMEEQLKQRSADEKGTKQPAEEGIIDHLHKQLFVERDNVRQLRQRNEQVEKVITQRNKENARLQDAIAEKDEEIENIHDELRRQKTKNITEVDCHPKGQLESMEITIRARNKEVDLLKLAIEQRDAEIERLTQLTRGLQQSLTRVLTNVHDLHPDVLSEASMLSSHIDSWKPTKERNLMPSMAPTAARVYTQQHHESIDHSNEDLDIRTLTTGNREYDNISSSLQGTQYRRPSADQDSVNGDDTTLSVSSTDEFVFKQELSNLDTIIARLQDSLRNK